MDTPQGAFSPFFPSQEAVKRQEMGATKKGGHNEKRGSDSDFPLRLFPIPACGNDENG